MRLSEVGSCPTTIIREKSATPYALSIKNMGQHPTFWKSPYTLTRCSFSQNLAYTLVMGLVIPQSGSRARQRGDSVSNGRGGAKCNTHCGNTLAASLSSYHTLAT